MIMNAQGVAVHTEPVEFRFKGARDYVQGPDLFNALVGIHPASALSNVHFTIHGFVRTARCEAHLASSREALSTLQDVRARANFDLRGETRWVALREGSPSVLAARDEYFEERITSHCRIDDHRVVLGGESSFTFIETAVAMNKYMHQRLFADISGRWIFTGIDLAQGCDARSGISLKIGSDLNPRLTRAEIVHEGRAIGRLFFSLLRQ